MERQKEERKRMKEEREQKKEEWKREMRKSTMHSINKAFEKIPRFDGTNPSHCFDWLEQTEALVNEHQGRIYREELLLNCGTSVSKTIHAVPQGATNQQIKDAVLHNRSNLRTVSQCSNAYQQLHQKPVSVTLNGPISKEQLYKIQEVQYRDRLKPEDRPATGEYAKSFNSFAPRRLKLMKQQ